MTEHLYDIEITRGFDAPPERVYQAFTDPDQFARWYGPVGFPVHRDSVEVDARVGGRQRFELVSEADPSMRTGFDGRFDEVVHNELLSSRGAWDAIPVRLAPGRQIYGWSSTTTTTVGPGWWCAKARTRPEPPTWAARRGR
jgi:uncharacterized protein YndB with AHSA1/START domain